MFNEEGSQRQVHRVNPQEEALKRREAQIDALLEAVPDPLYAVDSDWRITLINRAAETFFQKQRADLLGELMWDVLPQVSGTAMERRLRDAMDGETDTYFEVASTTRPGRFVNLRTAKKATGGLAIMFTDVTDHRAAQLRERQQTEEFRALADNIPTLCWMAYADGHIYWYNSRWYAYTGENPGTQAGWGWENVHDPDVLPLVVERWQACLRDGQPFEMVFPMKGADGVFRPFLTRVVPIRDAAGAITRWFGSNTEITEQVRQQQTLQTMVDELNHRVKNTLATIQSIASGSLRRASNPTEGYRAFEGRLMALSAAHNVLTDGLWESAELRTVLLAALRPFSQAPDGQIRLEGPDLWLSPATALALSLAVHELATNAVKYGSLSIDGGEVVLTWRLQPRGDETLLELDWAEHGGPPVATPTRAGFGSRLIAQILRAERGAFTSAFAADGFTCRLTLPLAAPGGPLALTGAAPPRVS